MSSKRKLKHDQSNSNEGPSTLKKMTVEEDIIESESDEIENNPTVADSKLRDDILKRFQCEPGKLLIAGNVAWNYVDMKGMKRNELHVFNRFTDGKVFTKCLKFQKR